MTREIADFADGLAFGEFVKGVCGQIRIGLPLAAGPENLNFFDERVGAEAEMETGIVAGIVAAAAANFIDLCEL